MRTPKPTIPKAPTPPPAPPSPPRQADPVPAIATATPASAAAAPGGRRGGLRGSASLVSTGPQGLRSRASTSKRSLIGGS